MRRLPPWSDADGDNDKRLFCLRNKERCGPSSIFLILTFTRNDKHYRAKLVPGLLGALCACCKAQRGVHLPFATSDLGT